MSIETLIAGKAIDQMAQNNIALLLGELNEAVRISNNLVPKPFVFLKSNNDNLSSNVNDGVLILNGPPMPAKTKGVVEDFNVNYTTAAGTVRLVILTASNVIRIDILRDISSSTNGTGRTVLEEGERLAVVGQTAGAGTFSVYCSGAVQTVIQ